MSVTCPYKYRAEGCRYFGFPVSAYLSYATRKVAHKRGELSVSKFAQTFIYRQDWKLEVDTTGIPKTFNFLLLTTSMICKFILVWANAGYRV